MQMNTEIRDAGHKVRAVCNANGAWHCTACQCPLQRTITGDIADGVLEHYQTVHPGILPKS